MSDEAVLADTPGLSWSDADPAQPLWFYRVAGLDCGGDEGP